jgi:DNA-binding PadR family transcriptional regulator
MPARFAVESLGNRVAVCYVLVYDMSRNNMSCDDILRGHMEFVKEITENLPLTETTFYILLSLAAEPSHGYRIMKEVEALSDDRVCLSTGTLYGALRRMLKSGWIERVEDPQASNVSDDRNRKYYALSQLGRALLVAEVRRLGELMSAARMRHVEVAP